MNKLVIISLLFALTAGCTPNETPETVEEPQPPPLDVEAELAGLETTRSAFMNAIKNKDFEALAGIATEDVFTVSPGSEDWLRMYAERPEAGPFPYDSIRIVPMETKIVSDSIAIDMGNSTVYYTNSEGNVVELHDPFLAILKKGDDGTWRLHREIASARIPE